MKSMIKVILALLMIRETQRHVVACFALRVLYRKKNTYISTQTRSTGKTQIRISNQKVQLKNSGLQKESNQTKQRKSNGKRNRLRLLFWIQGNFYSGKNLFKMVFDKLKFRCKQIRIRSSFDRSFSSVPPFCLILFANRTSSVELSDSISDRIFDSS